MEIQLTVAINFISSKDNNEEHLVHDQRNAPVNSLYWYKYI